MKKINLTSIIRFLFLIFLLVLAQGCATPYQKEGITGGFQEMQLSQNIWEVSFRGNIISGVQKTEDFLMLRNAELTLEQGYRYFSIAKKSTRQKVHSYNSPSSSLSSGTIMNSDGTMSHFDVITSNPDKKNVIGKSTRSTNTIILLKEKPQNADLIYDPTFIIKSIKAKYPRDFQP